MSPNQKSGIFGNKPLKVAIIGQSQFAADVLISLQEQGHIIVGVFTIPDNGCKEDPLAKASKLKEIPTFKLKTWRKAGKMLEEVYEMYKSINADLNVLPYCSQYIPMEIITYPRLQTICYHPSILPKHRGASAINWTLISGDKEAGLSIFWADDGLDTGPILLQSKCDVKESDTVDSLYNNFLYPQGVIDVVKAVNLVADGTAQRIPQSEKFASYDPMLNKKELQMIDWSKSGYKLHDFIRGLDSVPGAVCNLRINNTDEYQEVRLFGSSIWRKSLPIGEKIDIQGAKIAQIHQDGLLLSGNHDNTLVNIIRININGRVKMACDLLKIESNIDLEYSVDEMHLIDNLHKIWSSILGFKTEDSTHFFASGAGSMDVVRLIEEIRDSTKLDLENQMVFMSPIFSDFCSAVVLNQRNLKTEEKNVYKLIEIKANGLHLKLPCQMFINGKFIDAEDSKSIPIINPHNEEVICEVQYAGPNDVKMAVEAAKKAFCEGEWRKISARERGKLLFKLADILEEHKEELATIEAIDSGAVYTLALKTHVGMSIEAWRYFAGWCDKIEGATIPISNSRPNKNLTFTKREPIGVCALITPWNYPLMMLSWKMAACLAAGNTVVIKPCQVCPLTALKFAELSLKAGIPPGVINVIPGTGSVTGHHLSINQDVRKLGFTGSTEVGKTIMEACAVSNLKKVSLELGGKSPLVIFNDCDLDKAVRVGMQSVFFNKGENCIAAGRIFVEESIHDEFLRRVIEETKKIKIGDPLDRSTSHGPQNHLAHLQKLLEFVNKGVEEGARLEIGGKRLGDLGYYFQPTIFSAVEDNMFIAKEESFGPIMIISKFINGDINGVIKRSNANEYGLASGVFTKDINKALSFADQIEAGTVFINTYNKTDVSAPFGGFKQSGFGKDLGKEALNEYLKTKCVTVEFS